MAAGTNQRCRIRSTEKSCRHRHERSIAALQTNFDRHAATKRIGPWLRGELLGERHSWEFSDRWRMKLPVPGEGLDAMLATLVRAQRKQWNLYSCWWVSCVERATG